MALTEPELNGTLLASGGFTRQPWHLAPALTMPRTSLIGREAEIAEVSALFTQQGERLVTLTGPGGVGKTRLSFAVKQMLTEFFAGDVWFVPLDLARSPELVLTSIAQVLNVWEGGQGLLDQLISVLTPRRCLLVLDNFEQVMSAAPMVAELLLACPSLHVLTTSRETLHVTYERVFPVLPLASSPTGSAGDHPNAPSVQLFVDRARAVRNDFEPKAEALAAIATICRQLDGLPLAIELAAARTVILTPTQLLARLQHRLPILTGGARDSPARLQTMRSAIAWSCDLLPAAEQTLFRRLAVFAGGFTLDAAERVVGETGEGHDDALILDLITSLADKSLLRQESGPDGTVRFRMLETIREYALELLDGSSEAEAAHYAHAACYRDLAVQADAAFWCRGPGDWRALLEPDLDNLRQALAWSLARGEFDLALTTAMKLAPLWLYHGQAGEGADWLRQALAAGESSDALRARALEVAGLLAIRQGNYALASECAERGGVLASRAEDADAQARIAYLSGCIGSATGDDATAETHLDDARRRFEALDDRGRLAGVHCEMAVLGTLGGDAGQSDAVALARAEAHCLRGLDLYRELGLTVGIARALHGLGYIAYKSGRLRDALRYVQEALEQRIALREIQGINANLEDIADIAAHSGRPAAAARLYGAAEALRAFYGTPLGLRYRREYEAEVAVARRGLPAADFDAAWMAGRALTLEQAIAEALAFSLAPSGRGAAVDRLGLSARELDVLRLLAEGRSDREIAEALSISPRTVSHHVTGILAKLNVDNRTQATSRAVRERLI